MKIDTSIDIHSILDFFENFLKFQKRRFRYRFRSYQMVNFESSDFVN